MVAVEQKRGCGFRKQFGLYLCGDGLAVVCIKLPIPLRVCPVCGEGVRFSRGWKWVDPLLLTGGICTPNEMPAYCKDHHCPFDERLAGLMWIGGKFYTPESFTNEANEMGISKRISSIPKGLELGKTWILLAHKKAVRTPTCKHMDKDGICILATKVIDPEWVQGATYHPETEKWVCLSPRDNLKNCCKNYAEELLFEPGIFHAFKPIRIEKILPESMKADEKELEKLKKRGITPVFVPDNDPDHKDTVYDKQEEETDHAD